MAAWLACRVYSCYFSYVSVGHIIKVSIRIIDLLGGFKFTLVVVHKYRT